MRLNLNQKYFLLLAAGIIIFIVLRLPYRSYIYQHHIFDFYIADTSPNFLAILVFVFYKKWRAVTSSNLELVSAAFLGLVFYEYVIQIHIYDATIDNLDMLATLIGAMVAFYICKSLDNGHQQVQKGKEVHAS